MPGGTVTFFNYAWDTLHIRGIFNEMAEGANTYSSALGDSASNAQRMRASMKAVSDQALEVSGAVDKLNEKLKDEMNFGGLSSDAKEFFRLRQQGATAEQLSFAASALNRRQALEGFKIRQDAVQDALNQRASNPLSELAVRGSREERAILLGNGRKGNDDSQRKIEEHTKKTVDYMGFLREDVRNLPIQIARVLASEEAF